MHKGAFALRQVSSASEGKRKFMSPLSVNSDQQVPQTHQGVEGYTAPPTPTRHAAIKRVPSPLPLPSTPLPSIPTAFIKGSEQRSASSARLSWEQLGHHSLSLRCSLILFMTHPHVYAHTKRRSEVNHVFSSAALPSIHPPVFMCVRVDEVCLRFGECFYPLRRTPAALTQ